jgi:hypothetical protein
VGAGKGAAARRWAGALGSICLLLLILEFVLRLLPIISGAGRADPGTPAESARLKPNPDYTWSLGWDLRHVVHGKINSDGFVAPYEYLPGRPAIALFGDSYAEAIMLDHEESIAGRLNHLLGARALTFNFGISGAALPHYLGLARELRSRHAFSSAVLVVSPFDYLDGFRPQSGMYSWSESDPAALITLTPADRPRWHMRAARDSAVVRYVRYHLKFSRNTLFPDRRRGYCVPGQLAYEDRDRLTRYVRALPDALGLPPARVVIVFAGSTDQIYRSMTGKTASSACPSRDSLALDELSSLARAAGMQVLHAQRVLEEHYRRHRRQLDLKPVDGHWNSMATALIAERIAALLTAKAGDEISHPG